jgi:hypothetical protein
MDPHTEKPRMAYAVLFLATFCLEVCTSPHLDIQTIFELGIHHQLQRIVL